MNVLLVNPPQPEEDLKTAFGEVGYILPYSLLCLGTYLRNNNIDVDIVDCVAEKMSVEELLKIVKKNKYDIVGFTSFTFSAPRVFEAAHLIKDTLPNVVIVFGGIHATVLPLESLEECAALDYVVIGEGELTLLSLVKQLESGNSIENIPNIAYRTNKGVLLTKKVTNYIDVNKFPIADYSMLKMSLYRHPHSGNFRSIPTYSFYASRGCPFRCSFCSANIILGKRVRYKNIDKAVEEVKVLVRDYGAKSLLFQDSTFTINTKWVRTFCRKLIDEKVKVSWHANTRVDCIDMETLILMKKAGCYQLTVGVESADQKTLDLLQKGTTTKQNWEAVKMIKKVGINIGASFILGLPNEDMKSVFKTIYFAKKIGALFTQFYLPIPYPGTKLLEQCQDGLKNETDWHSYDSRDFTNAVYVNRNFEEETYKRLPKFAFHYCYWNVKALLRLFLSVRSYYELKDRFKTLWKILVMHLENSWKIREFSTK